MPSPMPLLLMLLAAADTVPVAGPSSIVAVAPPAGFEAWHDATAGSAGTGLADAGKVTISPGKAVDLTLASSVAVHYVVAPAKPAEPEKFGGLVQLRISRAGTYSLALDTAAWIDVVQDGRSIESVSHRRAPAGSAIHKIVDFPLQPGDYLVQIVGSGRQVVRIMAIALPES